MILNLVKAFAVCAGATLFYALLLRAPIKSLAVSAVLGGLGYAAYLASAKYITTPLPAYFLATLFIAASGEVLARIMKTPSTVFIIPAIIPLVPGYTLYKAMLLLVRDDFDGFIRTGVQTFFIAGAMAAAIALANFTARKIFPRKR